MANSEQLARLKDSVAVWNVWRRSNPYEPIDLSDAELTGAYLTGADLHGANLVRATLEGTKFSWADLSRADVTDGDLEQANLHRAYLAGTDLTRARLVGAELTQSYLRESQLSEANLYGADLGAADLTGADLAGADFTQVRTYMTVFGNLDLSRVRGLDAVDHIGPSVVGTDTIFRSNGQIPEAFLRGAGVPDALITYMASLVGQPLDYYTCFISYSSNDEPFAVRLHADLQAKGVRSWFAPEDLKIGARIRTGIDEAIRIYDKLVLVLSEHSIASQWVEAEVEAALAKERKSGKTVLFPIRLDDAVMRQEGGWAAFVRTRNIGDMRGWKDHDAYQRAFDRLLHDLRSEQPVPPSPEPPMESGR